jgi:ABC-2 type transport system ATP-binding protein
MTSRDPAQHGDPTAPTVATSPVVFAALTKRYGEFLAVDRLSLEVQRGEVFGFLGPNGAGKTTSIRMLMGILVPTSGKAEVEGWDCQRDRVEVARRVGYLPDNPIFYDYLRGREILEFVGEMHGLPRPEARARSARLLADLSLGDAADEFAVNYSTGMKKKLGLCCALIHDPPVLVLDEPTNGLDPRASREVQNRIRSSAADGKTVFLSTHLLDMAERLCHRVGIIDGGRLVAVGTVAELRSQQRAGGSLEEVFLKVTARDGQEAGEDDSPDGAPPAGEAAAPAPPAPPAPPREPA